MMRIGVQVMASAEGLPLPSFATPGSAGADLCAAVTEPVALAPGARALIPTGLILELPEGTEAQVRPRSGLALKHGVTVLNAPGTVDSDYRGEVGVILVNHGQEMFEVTRGMRIAQLVIAQILPCRFEIAEAVGDTARGGGGFGSTGGIG